MLRSTAEIELVIFYNTSITTVKEYTTIVSVVGRSQKLECAKPKGVG